MCEPNHWIAGGEAGEEAFQQLLLIAAVHHFRLPMNQYTYEPVYYLVFQLLTGKPFMWSTWINYVPTIIKIRHTWSYADLGDSVGCMEYRQHTIIGEKLIDLIMFELYLQFKILTIFISNPTNTNSAQFDFSSQKLISHFNPFLNKFI